jgi:hypothetical protein
MKQFLAACLAFLLAGNIIYAQISEKRSYTSSRSQTAISIDGNEIDASWNQVEWQGDFTQYEPFNGRNPGQKTRFKLVYDDENIYVLIRAFDTSPDSILKRLSRRDDTEGDLVGIQIDSYNDKLTAFTFIVSATGVKNDFLASNDGENEDESWDPIWYVATSIDTLGWLAEMRIPLDQLRFGKTANQDWGIEVARFLFRKQELSLWQPIPKDASGWVHQFGRLEGVQNLKTHRQIEIAPYYVASLTKNPTGTGNPFLKKNQWDLTKLGMDAKIGLTNNFIMDLTINPDFGQVEADPSEVNLSAFESYFSEKRPFFIEGKNLFSYPIMGGDGDMSDEGLFYSRRIGRRPQYDPELADNEYINMPEFTRILGAAKITGKTNKGLSMGIVESVTAREVAEIDQEGMRRKIAVEPVTSYSTARLQKEMDKGNTVIGGIFTATNRDIRDEQLLILPSSAYTGGLNFARYWKERKYYFTTRLLGSSVSGNHLAITNLQEAPARYYQRPDANHTTMDSTRTNLNGMAGRFEIGKMGGGHWRYATFITFKSPGFETNDLGYLRTTDEITEIAWVGYRIWEPFSIFTNLNLNFNQWREYNFAFIKAMDGGNFNFHTQLKNFWNLNGGINLNGPTRFSTLLRGGPMFIMPPAVGMFTSIGTDERKKFILEFESFNRIGANKFVNSQNYSLGITFKPSTVAQITIMPGYNTIHNQMQYVTTVDYTQDKRFIFGTIQQKTLDLSLRVNLSFTPAMSLQFWGQPFIASGNYSNFKVVTSPLADKFENRYHNYANNEISYDETAASWNIDENGDHTSDFTFENPDFKWSEFKSNLVYRWEYTPGSTIYFVWSQFRENSPEEFQFSPSGDIRDLFSTQPRNTWLIKFSYRFRA